jgi:hypothetical protein
MVVIGGGGNDTITGSDWGFGENIHAGSGTTGSTACGVQTPDRGDG